MVDDAELLERACKRWDHLPEGPDRDRRIKATFERMRDEVEDVALELPQLDEAELAAIRDEVMWNLLQERGYPADETEMQKFFILAEMHEELQQIEARYAKAPERVQRKLIDRRFMRSKFVRLVMGKNGYTR